MLKPTIARHLAVLFAGLETEVDTLYTRANETYDPCRVQAPEEGLSGITEGTKGLRTHKNSWDARQENYTALGILRDLEHGLKVTQYTGLP